jgi:hypothetical protein
MPLVEIHLPSITMVSRYFLSQILLSLIIICFAGILLRNGMFAPREERVSNAERRDPGIGLIMNFVRHRATLTRLSLGMPSKRFTVILFGNSYLFFGDVKHRWALAS